MILAIGDLTFLTDGTHYVCIWHPSAEDYKSPNAISLASIRVTLISDDKDFQAWKNEVQNRWKNTSVKSLGGTVEDVWIEPVSNGNTN